MLPQEYKGDLDSKSISDFACGICDIHGDKFKKDDHGKGTSSGPIKVIEATKITNKSI